MTPPQAAVKLKPCPFCAGSKVKHDRLQFHGAPNGSRPMLEELSDDAGGGWRVQCYGCGGNMRQPTREAAIAAWNRRPPSPTAAAEGVEARTVVDEQANDERLWFRPVYATEAILQQALRRLHAAVEGKSPEECAIAVLAMKEELGK